jgi:hypothetical protein
VAFIRHRSEIGVCFVRKPDGNSLGNTGVHSYVRSGGISRAKEVVDKPRFEGICKNQKLANL